MASVDEIKERVEELGRRHQNVSERKAKLEGILGEKKRELFALKQEIEAAGFDPKKLKEEREKLEAEIQQLVETFDKELSQVEDALAEYEK